MVGQTYSSTVGIWQRDLPKLQRVQFIAVSPVLGKLDGSFLEAVPSRIPDSLGNPDTGIDEEILAAYSLKRQMFAANFFRRQVARYKDYLEPSAVAAFTRWWSRVVNGFNQFAETQREFDGQAFAACDDWLARWMARRAKDIVAGKIEMASSQDKEQDEIARIPYLNLGVGRTEPAPF